MKVKVEPEFTYEVVLVGGSAGSVKPFQDMIVSLHEDFPLPIIGVLHLHAQSNFAPMIAMLSTRHGLKAKEIDDKETILPGTVYLAPANYHVLVEENRTLSLNVDNKVNYSRPSIDVLFESAVYAYGSAIIAVVLSGASRDGAAGLRSIERAGGLAVVQDPETADFATMPKSALEECEAAHPVRAGDIATFVQMMIFE